MNIFDKAIFAISPKMALKREVAKQQINILNSGYSHHGASTTKKSVLGWDSESLDVNADINENLDLLRQRSRDLYYGAPLATSAIKTMRTNVIGEGLKCKPGINYQYLKMSSEDARAWNEHVEFEFRLWAESVHCDAQRQNNFYELTQLAFLSYLMNGETLATLPYIERPQLPYDLRIMLIEADRLSSPSNKKDKVKAGIELGKYGEIVAYHIANKHPGDGGLSEVKHTRVLKFGKESGRVNILHLMEAERIGQTRGIPFLAPVIIALKQLSRYTEAEITSAVVSSFFTVFIENKQSQETATFGSADDYYAEDGDSDDDETEATNLALGAGSVLELEEGQTVKEANPGRQTNGFEGFVKAISKQIGAALELPVDILLKDFTKSYSASRAAMLQAWKMYKMRRTWMANDFCQPVYEEFLTEGVAKGRIRAPGFFNDPIIKKAYCTAEWHGPAQGQIDPLKEVNAAIKRVDQGFSTREKETTELTGGDFKNNIVVATHEAKMMKDSGLKEEVNAETVLANKK